MGSPAEGQWIGFVNCVSAKCLIRKTFRPIDKYTSDGTVGRRQDW